MHAALAAVILSVIVLARSTPAPPSQARSLQDPQDFTSDSAKKAAAKYGELLDKLDEQYAADRKKLAEQFVKDLEGARKAALAKPDLDEAQRILQAQADAQDAAAKPVTRRGFDVVTARWGALTQWLDVTTPVRAKIKDGALSLVPEQMNFPDPIDGTRKSLVVLYARDGRFDLAIAGDGQPLELPPRRLR